MKAGTVVWAQSRLACILFSTLTLASLSFGMAAVAFAQSEPSSSKGEEEGVPVGEGMGDAQEDPESEVIEEEAAREADLERIHEGFHMGPALSLGLPHWKFALDSRFGPAGFTVSYGYTPRSIGNIDLTVTNIEATLRAIPFRNPFYVALSFGQQTLRAEKKSAGRESATETMRSEYLTPHVGLQYNVLGDFFLAHELGFTLFTSSKRNKALSSGAGNPADPAVGTDPADETEVRDVASRYAKFWMPYVTLLRGGYLF